MPSLISSSSRGAITRLPYDILQEIFTQCLPQYPLHQYQPDTMTAPILLCHICSSWRRLVLASPTLWAHLSYRITVVEERIFSDWNSASRKIEFLESNIEFIQWWRMNQGRIPPFLKLAVVVRQRASIAQTLLKSSSCMPFLLEYLSSAQYLELDELYWELVHERVQVGHPMVFLNLSTVLLEYSWANTHAFNRFQTLLPRQAFPALRRLSIDNVIPPKDFSITTHWSTLTHLTSRRPIPLDLWLYLLRAVPHLQWGSFTFDVCTLPNTNINDTPLLPKYTLLELTTLFVSVNDTLFLNLVFPVSVLFTGLDMPILRTLSLSSIGTNAWQDRNALCELYTALASMPAVTTLTLEYKPLSSDTFMPPAILPAIPDAEPIWAHVKELAHLQLVLPCVMRDEPPRDEFSALFVHHIFSPESVWLDLQNPASPIRAITINKNKLLPHVSDFTMSSIQESARTVPKVVFEINSELPEVVAADVVKGWGLRRRNS